MSRRLSLADRAMGNTERSLFWRLAGLLLVTAALVSAMVIWVAEFLAVGPRAYMDEVALGRVAPETEELVSAYEILEVSAGLKPWDASMQLELGRLASWVVLEANTSNEKFSHWPEVAERHFQRAAELRPTWGVPWGELVILETRKLKPDLNNILHSLGMGLQLSPWEIDSQPALIWGGFAYWELLDYAQRDRLIAVARHAMNRNQRTVVDAAVHYHREKYIVDFLKPGTLIHGRFLSRLRKRDAAKRKESGGD